MDKLEVGKWYRDGLYLLGYYESVTKKPCFHVVYDLIYTGNDAASSFITEGLKPLETLTPKEALILLANGFVLKWCLDDPKMLIKFVDHQIKYIFPDHKKKEWRRYDLDLKGLTIHALPKEAGE